MKLRTPWIVHALVLASVALTLVALWVRGYELRRPASAEREVEEPSIPEPMQLLGAGARHRLDARLLWIADERQASWQAHFEKPFLLRDCPPLSEWIATRDGQALERLIADLTRGSAEEALAGLALTFQLARSTRWASRWSGENVDAARLLDAIEPWLAIWSTSSARDPLLAQPAIAAAMLYARVAREASTAPWIGDDEVVASRARVFLDRITGARAAARTSFGAALAEAHPRAFAMLIAGDDFLSGLAEECERRFPDLDGACGG